jgi:hypothetical protein
MEEPLAALGPSIEPSAAMAGVRSPCGATPRCRRSRQASRTVAEALAAWTSRDRAASAIRRSQPAHLASTRSGSRRRRLSRLRAVAERNDRIGDFGRFSAVAVLSAASEVALRTWTAPRPPRTRPAAVPEPSFVPSSSIPGWVTTQSASRAIRGVLEAAARSRRRGGSGGRLVSSRRCRPRARPFG